MITYQQQANLEENVYLEIKLSEVLLQLSCYITTGWESTIIALLTLTIPLLCLLWGRGR
jgi:hypothetical protein